MNGIVLNGTMDEIVRKLRFVTDGKKHLTLEQFVKGQQLKREMQAQLNEIARDVRNGN